MDSLNELAQEIDVEPSLLNDAMRDVIHEMGVEERAMRRSRGLGRGRSGEAPGRNRNRE